MSRWIPSPQIYNLPRLKWCLYIQSIKVISIFSCLIIIIVVLLTFMPSSSVELVMFCSSVLSKNSTFIQFQKKTCFPSKFLEHPTTFSKLSQAQLPQLLPIALTP